MVPCYFLSVTWTGNEKRLIGDRRRIELDVNLATYGPYSLSKLLNISTGGVFITTPHLEQVGTEIKMRFRLPGEDDVIEAEGKVVWIYDQPISTRPNASGMGIKFTKISLGDQEKIALFVSESTGG
jgi:uncharacterized protein (TIGR02266 family)